MNQAKELQDLHGLTLDAVQTRLQAEGHNELPTGPSHSLWQIAWEVVSEPIFLLLAGCGGIYFVLGDAQEAFILLGFIILIVGISLYQEQKTEQSLAALRDLSSPRALVIRQGQRQRIPGREVVRGDLLVLAEGDRVPADAELVWSTHLTVDESLLTGESLPVAKQVKRTDLVYAGTLVVQGQAIAEVTAVGLQTQMGQIGKALQTVVPEDTRLQRETRRIVGQLTWVALGICATVIVIYGSTRGDWLQAILSGLALAMAILPNEIPVVLTIFLALGAWRFSRQQVLTRRIPVVETLGSVTVLCVDKTGTLTFNQMAVGQLFVYQHQVPQFYDLSRKAQQPLPEAFHGLIEFGILASRKDPFDPMEKALQQIGQDYLAQTEHLHGDWQLRYEYPLSGELLAMSCVWADYQGQLTLAAKGAPEAIAELCHLDPNQVEDLNRQVQIMARAGLRVLGVARGQPAGPIPKLHRALSPEETLAADIAMGSGQRLPVDQHEFEFTFVGLVGLSDPVRPTVPAAVQDCLTAGIRVVMITGDYPETARQIGQQIGLPHPTLLTGAELQSLSAAELDQQLDQVNIFARVVPTQKLEIVQALQRQGEIVAMTGDGVNDAPALKAANVGIAMGERGTDVAREAADLVLLKDDFAAIVAAIRLGRRIFANLKKGIVYTLAVHIPIAGMSLIPVLLGWPIVLLPIHIACLHLVIDPACTIVFEAEPTEPGIMQRPPRPPNQALFDPLTLRVALLQGLIVLAALLGMFALGFYGQVGRWGMEEPNSDELVARSLTFTTLIIANLSLIFANRSGSQPLLQMWQIPNRALVWVCLGTLAGLGLILWLPFLQQLFRLAPLSMPGLLICLLVGSLSGFGLEIFKRPK